jgi:hypothetical protein
MGICCIALAAALLLGLSPGFTNLRTSVKDLAGKPTSFHGLGEAYGGPMRTDTVKLMVVHGIGKHDHGYSKVLTDRIADRMKLQRQSEDPPVALDAPPLPAEVPFAQLVRRTYGAPGRTLVVFEVTWSPLVNGPKETLETFEIGRRSERALLNRTIKESIVNDGLSDAVMYLGTSGPYMRNAIKQTVCLMLNGKIQGNLGEERCADAALEPTAAIALAVESLGSKITFDSLTELEGFEEAKAVAERVPAYLEPGTTRGHSARQFIGGTASIFMLANQLPLIALARSDPAKPPAATAAASSAPPPPGAPAPAPSPAMATLVQQSGLAKVLTIHRDISAKQWQLPLEVVTISDPNDLLSYPLPPEFAQLFDRRQVRFVNVTTLIAPRFLSGAVANPIKAHTGHVDSPKVMRMLVDGGGKP